MRIVFGVAIGLVLAIVARRIPRRLGRTRPRIARALRLTRSRHGNSLRPDGREVRPLELEGVSDRQGPLPPRTLRGRIVTEAVPLAPVEDGWVHIYALLDPETEEVRYIGKSIRPRERLLNHMNEVSNCHRSHWLQGLKARGLMPQQVILESVRGEWPWQESKRFWIAYGKRLGWRLTNNTDGGDGVTGLPAETRERMRRVWLGRKHKPESVAKMAAKLRGKKHTEEYKAFMRRTMKERIFTTTHRQRLREAGQKLTPEQVREIRERLGRGERQKSIAARYGVDKGTISNIKRRVSYAHVPDGDKSDAVAVVEESDAEEVGA